MSYGPYMQQHTYHIKDKMKKTVIFFKSEFLPSPASTDALQIFEDLSCHLLPIFRKSLIINGAGEGRRTLITRSKLSGAPEGENCSFFDCWSDWFSGRRKASKRTMKEDQHRFMSLLGQLPARLTAEQTAWALGCQPHDIPALVTARLLKPLGNPPPNGIKYFCTAGILDLFKDRSWLNRASNSITLHWQRQNSHSGSRRAKDSGVDCLLIRPNECQ